MKITKRTILLSCPGTGFGSVGGRSPLSGDSMKHREAIEWS